MMTPKQAQPRDINPGDIDWLHALNEAHAVELSSLTRERLVELIARAFYAKSSGERAAFLMAFDQDADYDSPNFLYFKTRFPRFVYIDRVVVSASARRRGLAKNLYEDLFREAHTRDHRRVVCEVNANPPNAHSDAFHATLGFSLVGEAHLGDRAKSVRYLCRDLPLEGGHAV